MLLTHRTATPAFHHRTMHFLDVLVQAFSILGLHADKEPFNVICQVVPPSRLIFCASIQESLQGSQAQRCQVGVKLITLWPPDQRPLLYPGDAHSLLF